MVTPSPPAPPLAPPSAPPPISAHATIILENVALLAGGPEGFERRYGLALHIDTFRRPGAVDASAAVLHFLLLVIDGSDAAAKLAHCYPVLDKAQERDFRRVVEGRLVAIERAKMLPLGLTRKTVVQSGGGARFEMLVALLSTLALKKLSARHPAHAVTHNLVLPVRNSFNAAPGDYVKLLRMRIAAERVVFARTTQVGKGSAERFEEEKGKLDARVEGYRKHVERLTKEVEAAEKSVGSEASGGGGSDVSDEGDDRAALDALLQRFRRAAAVRKETESGLDGVERQEEEITGKELNCRNGQPMDIVQVIAEATAELKAAEVKLRECAKRERSGVLPDRKNEGEQAADASTTSQPSRLVSDISCDSVDSLEGGVDGGDAAATSGVNGSGMADRKDRSMMNEEEELVHGRPGFEKGKRTLSSVRRHRSILDMSVELTEEATSTAKLAREESRGLLDTPIKPSEPVIGRDLPPLIGDNLPRRSLLGVRASSPTPQWTTLKVGVANDSIDDMTLLAANDDDDDIDNDCLDDAAEGSIHLSAQKCISGRASSVPVNAKSDVAGETSEGKRRSRKAFLSAMDSLRVAPTIDENDEDEDGFAYMDTEAAKRAALSESADPSKVVISGSSSSLEDAADIQVAEVSVQGPASVVQPVVQPAIDFCTLLPAAYQVEVENELMVKKEVASALSSAEGRMKQRGARAVRFAQLPQQSSTPASSSASPDAEMIIPPIEDSSGLAIKDSAKRPVGKEAPKSATAQDSAKPLSSIAQDSSEPAVLETSGPAKRQSRKEIAKTATPEDEKIVAVSETAPSTSASSPVASSSRQSSSSTQKEVRRRSSDAGGRTGSKGEKAGGDFEPFSVSPQSFDEFDALYEGKSKGKKETAPTPLPASALSSSSSKSTHVYSAADHKSYTPVIGRQTTVAPAATQPQAPVRSSSQKSVKAPKSGTKPVTTKGLNTGKRLKGEQPSQSRKESTSSPALSFTNPDVAGNNVSSLPRRMFGLKGSHSSGDEKRGGGKKTSGDHNRRSSLAGRPYPDSDGEGAASSKDEANEKQEPVRRSLSVNMLGSRPLFRTPSRSKSEMKEGRRFSFSNKNGSRDSFAEISIADGDTEGGVDDDEADSPETARVKRYDSDINDYSTRHFRDNPPGTGPSPRKQAEPTSLSERFTNGFSKRSSSRNSSKEEKSSGTAANEKKEEKSAGSTTKDKLSSLRERFRRLG